MMMEYNNHQTKQTVANEMSDWQKSKAMEDDSPELSFFLLHPSSSLYDPRPSAQLLCDSVVECQSHLPTDT